jgi:hypothetical protein
MRYVRALGFDALEARKLLTGPLVAPHHTTPIIAATPVVLDGTLVVDSSAATSSSNSDGSSTTSTPVVGDLGTLGKVRGVWNQIVDEFCDTDGPDVPRLQLPKGSLIITFYTLNTVPAHPAAHGAVYYSRAQQLCAGTGAYAGTTESGMIDLTTNYDRNQIVGLKLISANK